MTTRALTITIRQPTQVSTRVRVDNILETEGHLPGAAVRGALAAAWIARNGSPTGSAARSRFEQLFEGGVRFAPAYHASPPVSLAVRGHKYGGGDDCDPFEIDEAKATAPLTASSCPHCGQAFVELKGLRSQDRPPIGRHTSVAISDANTAKDGQLFSRDSLKANITLTGSLTGSLDLLEELAGLGTIVLGGRRTSHGLAGIALGESDVPAPKPQRIGRNLIFRFASPAIFVDDTGRPSLLPNEAELSEQLGTPCRIDRAWARWDEVGGWHAASGLPKSMESVAAAGSTYAITPSGKIDDQALAALSERGLGLRRHEGFGHFGRPTQLSLSPAGVRRFEAEVSKLVDNLSKVRGDAEVLAALRRFASGQESAKQDALTAAAPLDHSLRLASAQVKRATDAKVCLAVLSTALERMGDPS